MNSMLPEPPGFSQLSKEQQLRYLEELWDRIVDSPGELPVPETHLHVVEERLANYRRDPSKARPASEIIDRLSSKRR